MAIARSGQNFVNGYFRPDMFSKNVLVPFYEQSLAPKITNSDYLGEIKGGYGETIYVVKNPAVILSDTSVNAATVWTDVVEERTSFTLSYLKSVAAKISKIDKDRNMMDPMKPVVEDIKEKMKVAVDTAILQGAPSSATTTYDCATAWTTAGQPAKDIMLGAASLDLLRVPQSDRYLVLDPVSAAYIKADSSLWAQNAGTSQSPLKSGQIGILNGGMEVYTTSLLSHDGTGAGTNGNQQIGLMGHRSAITLAVVLNGFEYFDKLENYQNSEGVSGTLLFGYGVIRPDALVAFKPLWA